jgi:S-formylglutathione hydrolase
MTLETISLNRSHGGVQGVYKHASHETRTTMTFSVYVPPHQGDAKLPVVWYLSGLTCTHANVTEKGEFREACSELGLIFVEPDTSPRGEGVPGDPAGAYDFGLGAGFYVDATQAPFANNYRMWSYVTEELSELIVGHFPVDPKRQSILGHSMGGHGALTIALRHPARYRAASAFSPIVAPSQVPWGIKALGGYLGDERTAGASTMLSPLSRMARDLPISWSTMATPINSWPSNFALTCWSAPASRRQSRLPFVAMRAMITATISYRPTWKITCAGTPRD